MYWIYDIFTRKNDLYTVRLPEEDGMPVVEVTPKVGGSTIVVYDGRRHPAHPFFGSDREPVLEPNVKCPKCGSSVFRVAVGFEVPPDAESANDTSWFALALECEACGLARIAYEDETT
jgi:hypothetical protein